MTIVEAEAELLQAASSRTEPHRERRRLQWRLQWRPALALAATLLMLAGGTTAVLLRDGDTVVTAQLGNARLIDKGNNGHATLEVENLDPPGPARVYQVWLQHEGRAPAPTNALFSTHSDGTASVDVPGSLENVVAVLVTEEPEGGSKVPSSAPVIVARPT